MEQADAILVDALRQAGCEFDATLTLRSVSSAMVVEAVATALNVITQSSFPKKLPPHISARHKICQALGNKVKELGYTGEAGFNMFLYPNERDTRRLLIWLVERLPKSKDEAGDVEAGSGGVDGAIRAALAAWLAEPWAPELCDRFTASGLRVCRYGGPRLTTSLLSVPCEPDTRQPFRPTSYAGSWVQRVVTAQVPPERVAASVLERGTVAVAAQAAREEALGNAKFGGGGAQGQSAIEAAVKRAFDVAAAAAAAAATSAVARDLAEVVSDIAGGQGRGKGKGSAFERSTEFGQEKSTVAVGGDEDRAKDEETLKQERAEELERRRQDADAAKGRAARALQESELATARARQLTTAVSAEKAKTPALEHDYLVRKKTLEMLPESARHIAELREICGGSAQRLVSLAATWEKHRRPLIDGIRTAKEAFTVRKEECKRMVQSMRQMRGDMKVMANEMQVREERLQRLKEECEKVPQHVRRSQYTSRIMDVIVQTRKQRAEIARIIADIHDVQREINSVSEKLRRTEALADEKIFAVASEQKDQAFTLAYKYLAQIRELFGEIIDTVGTMAKVEIEGRDYDARSAQLSQADSDKNLDQIRSDLALVRKENEELKRGVRAAAPPAPPPR